MRQHKYSLPDDIVQKISFLAKFELHSKEAPECVINIALHNWEAIKRNIADRVIAILIEQEINKLVTEK